MRTTTNPIFVNFGFLGNNREIVPGTSPEVYVSINNRGTKNAVIDVFIEVTDENSLVLNQWIDPKRVRLTVNAEEEKIVTFQIQIPENAWPYDYRYDVVLDAPDHYPEHTPLSYPQILKVLPAPNIQKHGGEDPCFFLTPATNSGKPQNVKCGDTFEVEVSVENRTALVDRFYLMCSDLKPEFFSVQYPEIRDQYGLIVESDGLELNPSKSGKIKLKFHPPSSASAGNYYPTIRLASVNNPRLNLLDVVYLHIPPSYDLEVDIETLKDRIKDPKSESGEYEFKISNQGNIERSLVIKTRNRGWGSLAFSIDPDFKTLEPGSMSQVQILARPLGRWWNRPFYGIGRDFNFCVELEDLSSLPLPQLMPEAKLTWEPYPKKWFIFFVILLSVLGVGGAVAIAFAIWNTFFRQPPAPTIIELLPSKSLFKEANNEAIQLNWKIQNAKSIGKLVLSQQGASNGEVKTFIFKGSIPTELSLRNPSQTDNYCSFQTIKSETQLVCRGIITSARKPGQYQFEMQVFNQKDLVKPANILKTDTIQIISAGLPKITDFTSPKPEYFFGAEQSSSTIPLNWEIANPAQIDQIMLVGLAKDGTVATQSQQFDFQNGKVPKLLTPFCKTGNSLTCLNFPMTLKKPGIYNFRLSVRPKQVKDGASLTKLTDFIRVKSIPTIRMPLRQNVQSVLNPVITSQGRIQGNQKSQDNNQLNAFIPPSSWPPNSSRNSRFYRPSPSSKQLFPSQFNSSPAARQKSIQNARDIEKGLLVANNTGLIPTYSQTWKKVQNSISLLNGGNSLEKASQDSGVSMDILTSLISWGQSKKSPQNPATQTKSTQSISPQPSNTFIPNATKPPEPLWGSSRPSIDPASKQGSQSSEPLW
jgi:hypothetical protein